MNTIIEQHGISFEQADKKLPRTTTIAKPRYLPRASSAKR